MDVVHAVADALGLGPTAASVFRCGAEGVWVRVSKNDTICGLAAPTARQLMRAYFDDRPVEVACDILGVSQDAARDQMRAFEAAGYVERGGLAHAAGDGWWATTVKGNALANASFGKPISRATATRLLSQVIERAGQGVLDLGITPQARRAAMVPAPGQPALFGGGPAPGRGGWCRGRGR